MSDQNGNDQSGEKDFYILPDGRYVMTESYLLRRGYCCGNGCLHCPYDYMNVPEPARTRLLERRKDQQPGANAE